MLYGQGRGGNRIVSLARGERHEELQAEAQKFRPQKSGHKNENSLLRAVGDSR